MRNACLQPRRAADRDRGAAAVEFALVAPLLLLILFAIISYGYLLSFRQAMSQGAAEGARAAAVWASSYNPAQNPQRIAAGKTQVSNALNSYGVACASGGATCTVSIGACGTAQCVTVTVTYPYAADPLVPTLPLIPLPSRLSYTATARVS